MSQFDSAAGEKKAKPKIRFLVFAALFSFAALAVLFQYALVMLSPSTASTRSERAFGERGPILDRNGRILAMQTRLGNVTIWRPEVVDLATLSRELAPLLEMDAAELEARIAQSASDFVYAKKRVDQSTIRVVEEGRAAGRLKGVGIEPVVGRVYPEKSLAGQLIGFVGDGNEGLAGIEYAFQADLAPAGASGYGDQVFLTIDANVQHILEGVARKTMLDNKAEAVMMIAMDPRNGDILGYAAMPDFDPNDIRSSEERERMDRSAIWAYEPGSVFKIFSLSAMMELGGIDASSTFVCDGQYEQVLPSGERIVIKCLGAHGHVTPREIITYSCNAGTAYASEHVGAAAFAEKIQAFGFGAKTDVGISGETAGFIRPVERWSLRSKPTIAIGQELAVSALQMVQAATAVANDGVLVKPRVVSRVVASDGSVKKNFEPSSPRRVLSPETAREMRRFMVAAASDAGTGRRANVADLPLAVKTGTAQLIDPATGTYSETDFIASCIAMIPAEAPTLVLYNVIIKPSGPSYLGGRIAAPPIREAADQLVDYLGIPRGRNPTVSHSGAVALGSDEPLEITDTMPDLRGMDKRRLLPLLLRDDLKVEIVGEGWVRTQSPEPGTPLERGTVVHLELK